MQSFIYPSYSLQRLALLIFLKNWYSETLDLNAEEEKSSLGIVITYTVIGADEKNYIIYLLKRDSYQKHEASGNLGITSYTELSMYKKTFWAWIAWRKYGFSGCCTFFSCLGQAGNQSTVGMQLCLQPFHSLPTFCSNFLTTLPIPRHLHKMCVCVCVLNVCEIKKRLPGPCCD